ncbi:MAG: FHA domain-containing protein [Planctomycetota bacterium]|jgi:pSer/pThr/pTyr-binding forkhead associated (FHA) protein
MEVNLVLFKKNGSQKAFPLPSSVTVIGRRHNCDLCIPLMSVSKKHCQLNHDEGILKIRDLGSRNGTILNGKPIDEAVVKAGDSIGIGPLAFVFQIDGKPETITRPQQPVRSLPKRSAPAEDIADEQFASAVELDEDLELDDDLGVGDSDLLLDDSELLEED